MRSKLFHSINIFTQRSFRINFLFTCLHKHWGLFTFTDWGQSLVTAYLVDILRVGGATAAAGAGADLPLNTLCRVWLLLLLLLELGLLLLLLLLQLLLLLLQLDRSDRLLLRTGQVTWLYAHIAGHHAWTGAAVWWAGQWGNLKTNTSMSPPPQWPLVPVLLVVSGSLAWCGWGLWARRSRSWGPRTRSRRGWGPGQARPAGGRPDLLVQGPRVASVATPVRVGGSETWAANRKGCDQTGVSCIMSASSPTPAKQFRRCSELWTSTFQHVIIIQITNVNFLQNGFCDCNWYFKVKQWF